MSDELTLWVVGEASGDHTQWGEYGGRILILAASAEEALIMADAPLNDHAIYPLDLTRRGVVVRVPS